jgi:UDP-N-acetylglucosamine diphosphorylase / glucose-1-phosphate thymidylyltransferase / UDP-N-acetylgalactosamine diphosphorylase / glucosamine-1-phosphate N-acetyltransferase / galactosamine-1-phosphate N-acetyltransferase
MSIALFEDSYWQNFSPISLTRATFDVKVGARSFFEEHQLIPETLLTREYLTGVTGERHTGCQVNPSSIDGDTIFVNGLLHPGAINSGRMTKVSRTFVITSGDRLLLARLGKKDTEYLADNVAVGKKIDVRKFDVEKSTNLGKEESIGLLSEPWDIIQVLENSLALQAEKLQGEFELSPVVRVMGGHTIAIDKNATVEEGTVLDARQGGIYIGPDAYVATSRIVGPTYIGGRTQVKQFTIIESSYIGYNCRVAGEIDHSLICDHSNKAHAGFIGHSYVGEWVNVGAMTTTSDLKMTYGNIKVGSGKAKVDTGQNKVGSFIADMAKTSIGTLIYSGSRIGVCSQLHGLVAQDVPDFTIYGSSVGAMNVELELLSAIQTQMKMMARRSLTMSNAYEKMIKEVFSNSAIDRKRAGVRKARFTL